MKDKRQFRKRMEEIQPSLMSLKAAELKSVAACSPERRVHKLTKPSSTGLAGRLFDTCLSDNWHAVFMHKGLIVCV